jgi:hypothetical protein
MQKNVAAVAIVYCISHVPSIIRYGEVAFQSEDKMITLNDTTVPSEIMNFFVIVNNAINLLMYVLLGEKFRKTLFTVLTECRQKRRRGQMVGTLGISNQVQETSQIQVQETSL